MAALLAPFVVQADPPPPATTDGKLGEVLSAQLYCGVKTLVEGNIGLAIGLLIMFAALWSLARGGKMAPALISIMFGALITALPSLVESSMGGLAQLMSETGMTDKGASFEPPQQCENIDQQVKEEYLRREEKKKLEACYGETDCR